MKIEDIVKEEVSKLTDSINSQINDPAQKAAIVAMTTDLAMLPIRMARGEDVSVIVASLKAEAAMRGVASALKAQAAVQQAWINIVTKVIMTAISAA